MPDTPQTSEPVDHKPASGGEITKNGELFNYDAARDKIGSRFGLTVLAARRARQIKAYLSETELVSGLVPPQVEHREGTRSV